MTTIGYMLNTYDEYGPERIAVFAPDADLREALARYCEEHKLDGIEEELELKSWLSDENRAKNKAHDLCNDWGGVQITELAVK